MHDEFKGGLREAEKEINKIKGDVSKDLLDTNDIVKYTLESDPLSQPKSSTVVMPVSEEKLEEKDNSAEK